MAPNSKKAKSKSALPKLSLKESIKVFIWGKGNSSYKTRVELLPVHKPCIINIGISHTCLKNNAS